MLHPGTAMDGKSSAPFDLVLAIWFGCRFVNAQRKAHKLQREAGKDSDAED